MAKCDWSMSEATQWVKEHGKEMAIPEVKMASQAQLIDEVDYLKLLIDEVGLNEDALKALRELLMRLPGSDIPVEIKQTEVEPVMVAPLSLDIVEVALVVAKTIARMRGKIS